MKNEDVPTLLEEGALLPLYASEEAAGADIRAHIQEEIIIGVGEVKLKKQLPLLLWD